MGDNDEELGWGGEGLLFANVDDAAAAAAAACICWLWCCKKLAIAAADELGWWGKVGNDGGSAALPPNGGEDEIPDAKDVGRWGAPKLGLLWGAPGNDKADGGGFWRAAAAAAWR